jgi:hypothetical protein
MDLGLASTLELYWWVSKVGCHFEFLLMSQSWLQWQFHASIGLDVYELYNLK